MSILLANKVSRYFWALVFRWPIKSESAYCEHGSLTFFIQRLQTFFILVTFFTFFNVFFILISTFFTSMLNTAYSYLLSFKCAVCLTSLGGGSAISCEG